MIHDSMNVQLLVQQAPDWSSDHPYCLCNRLKTGPRTTPTVCATGSRLVLGPPLLFVQQALDWSWPPLLFVQQAPDYKLVPIVPDTKYRIDAIQLQYWLARNNRVANSLFNQCVRTWNVLGPVIRNTPTFKEFKLKQKKWLKYCIPVT